MFRHCSRRAGGQIELSARSNCRSVRAAHNSLQLPSLLREIAQLSFADPQSARIELSDIGHDNKSIEHLSIARGGSRRSLRTDGLISAVRRTHLPHSEFKSTFRAGQWHQNMPDLTSRVNEQEIRIKHQRVRLNGRNSRFIHNVAESEQSAVSVRRVTADECADFIAKPTWHAHEMLNEEQNVVILREKLPRLFELAGIEYNLSGPEEEKLLLDLAGYMREVKYLDKFETNPTESEVRNVLDLYIGDHFVIDNDAVNEALMSEGDEWDDKLTVTLEQLKRGFSKQKQKDRENDNPDVPNAEQQINLSS